MNFYNTVMLLAGANFVLCSGVVVVCLCRMNVMTHDSTARSWRAMYTLLQTAFAANGLQPIVFGEWPGFATVCMSAVVLLFLLLSSKAWRHGQVPSYAARSR